MSTTNISWKCVSFSDLSLKELHDLLRLRVDVFVVEQDCPYPELDGRDEESFHLLAINEVNELVAYTRILPAGLVYDDVSLGRVLVAMPNRGTGLGEELLIQSMSFIQKHFGEVPVRIGAQTYLEKFYQKHGFQPVGESYLEDGIPHIEMLFKVS